VFGDEFEVTIEGTMKDYSSWELANKAIAIAMWAQDWIIAFERLERAMQHEEDDERRRLERERKAAERKIPNITEIKDMHAQLSDALERAAEAWDGLRSTQAAM